MTTKVGDFVARERVTQVRVFPHNSLKQSSWQYLTMLVGSQSFRDALHNKYRSSNTSKKTRRKEELKKAKEGQSASPIKKAKTQHQALRLPPEPPQVYLAGFHGDVVPSMTPVGQNDAWLEQPLSSSLHASVTSLPASIQMAPFAAACASTTVDSLPEMPLLEHRRLEPQGLGYGGSQHLSSLGRQLQTLQRLNHGDQSGQTTPYPPRWFRVASEENVQLPSFESMPFSNNLLPTLIQGNQLLPGLVASSAVDALLPSLQYRNQAQATDMTPIALPATAVDFGAFRYAADDNPFEPVPIAENISLRHAQSRQEEKEKTSDSFDAYNTLLERADFIN